MRLDQWTADDVENLASGDAEILRGTYFGELVLTPSDFENFISARSLPFYVGGNPTCIRRWMQSGPSGKCS